MQALKLALCKIESDQVSDSEKARYLAWLFHLVGDLHQPLHSAKLFTVRVFPKGDAGGNSITVGGSNLHSKWDGFPGRVRGGKLSQINLPKIRDAVDLLLDDNALVQSGKKGAQSLSFDDWVEESYELAIEDAYSTSVRAKVAKAEEKGWSGVKVKLSKAYVRKGKEIARRRVVEAGYRLAELLKGLDL